MRGKIGATAGRVGFNRDCDQMVKSGHDGSGFELVGRIIGHGSSIENHFVKKNTTSFRSPGTDQIKICDHK